jgi:bifunctional DNA-binding transcriptional regulator/antitoxin component of YhaV-PrlF toxin-antitoxin module
MKTIITAQWQITIPQPLDRRLGRRAGQAPEVSEEADRLVLTKAGLSDLVESIYGIVKMDHPSDRLMNQLRGGDQHP